VTTAPSMPLLHDVTLRDGLMSLAPLDHGLKRAIAAGLVAAGVCHLEIIRFPIDGRYPQFDDGLALLADLQPLRLHGAVFAAFAVGDAGIDAALVHAGLYDELHVPCFVSDAYAAYAFASWRWRDSLDQISRARRRCDDAGVRLTVGLGTAFGCPLTPGPPHSDATVAAFRDLVALEPAAIMLGDTAGQASPGMVAEVLARIAEVPTRALVRGHFHNTFGRALLNSVAAASAGIGALDVSLLGLGGEPHPYFAVPGSVDNGNCATEELVAVLVGDVGHPGVGPLYRLARRLAAALDAAPLRRSCFAELVAPPAVHAPGGH
jgi:hydroxymethylglutaryl-CoA lyase